jgi:LysR family hydrogen peroxide-inducible transcriptional activator
MNLSQLRFVAAVASTGSFTAAAADCCVTQPTLSNGIAQLETELGERLFVRTTRTVALTPFGAHVLPYVKEVLSAQASLVQQTQAFLSPGKRLIRIGTSPLVSANLLGLMIEPFRLRNPSVEVVLREMNMTDLFRMLEEGLLDFVFGIADAHKATVTSTFLYEEALLYVPRGAARTRDSRIQSVQLRDIAGETFVMVPDACGLARAIRALFRSHRRKLHEYSGEAMSYKVLEEWAALGIGAAILPKSKVAAGGLAACPITDKSGREVSIRFEAVWSHAATRAAHLHEFAHHLRRVVPGLVGGLGRDMPK